MYTRTAEGALGGKCATGFNGDWGWTVARAEMPVTHADFASLYRLWEKRRNGGALPGLDDFPFDELAPWLGNISVARAIRDDFELELLGCSMVDECGREASRITLSNSRFGPVGASAREMLETVTDMGVVALPCGTTEWRGRTFGWHGIALPLASRSALMTLHVVH